MNLSMKMTALFSVMMLTALAILSSYAAQSNVDGANAFTKARFLNMSITIQRDLERDFSMMELTLNELSGNASFMAALNQVVRDDSADHKMQRAAAQSAVQQLYQSPLVDHFYRVTFYTRDGLFITSRADKDSGLISGTQEAADAIGALPWLDEADQTSSFLILAPHDDIFSSLSATRVYGVVQRVFFRGKPIGYLEVSREYGDLNRIAGYLDNRQVVAQVAFEDGSLLYSTTEDALTWADDLPENTLDTVQNVKGDIAFSVLYQELKPLHLRLYIAQDNTINLLANRAMWHNMFKIMLYIMLPTLGFIIFCSLGLTRSIRRLTKKVRLIPVGNVLGKDPALMQELTTTVASSGDKEVHELEQVFNAMMLRLQDSATTELTLREGALQARLSALQTQINPHFIYNTLNIISAKAMESGNFDIIEICDQFAQMLRYSTDTRSQTATLSSEIENMRNYLMLAKARYEDNLEFSIDVPESLGNIILPKLSLQPIVENALTHGFDGNNVLRRLSIRGWLEQNRLYLEIRDNGTGFSDEMLKSLNQQLDEIGKGSMALNTSGGHIGLINTCLRLYYYSKGAIRVSLRNDNGAVVTLTMPETLAEES